MRLKNIDCINCHWKTLLSLRYPVKALRYQQNSLLCLGSYLYKVSKSFNCLKLIRPVQWKTCHVNGSVGIQLLTISAAYSDVRFTISDNSKAFENDIKCFFISC